MLEHSSILEQLGYLGQPIDTISPPDGTNDIPTESHRVVERMRMIPPGQNHEFVRGTPWQLKVEESVLFIEDHYR